MRRIVDLHCPECAAKISDSVLQQLASTPFDAVMGSHVSNLDSNYREPVLDAVAKSWTIDRMLQAETVDAFAARSFFYNVCDASNLFLGDATSFNSNYGWARNKEYVAPKIRLADLSVWKSIKVPFK